MTLAKCYPDGPLVLGKDDVIADFVVSLIPWVDSFGPCRAIGIIRRERLVGGFVFHNYRPQYRSVEFSGGFTEPYWPSRDVFRSLCQYGYLQLGCDRAYSLTPKHNKPARKFLEWAGFKLEGCARKGFGRYDAMIYGMLRNECRWLERQEENGKLTPARSAAA